jgi:hypothetical protein
LRVRNALDGVILRIKFHKLTIISKYEDLNMLVLQKGPGKYDEEPTTGVKVSMSRSIRPYLYICSRKSGI